MENELSREQIEEVRDAFASDTWWGKRIHTFCDMALKYLGAKADAQRYRYRREQEYKKYVIAHGQSMTRQKFNDEYDAAIDQARGAGNE